MHSRSFEEIILRLFFLNKNLNLFCFLKLDSFLFMNFNAIEIEKYRWSVISQLNYSFKADF